jgi:hypothetical protein
MEVKVTPVEGDLDCIVEVSDVVIATNEQATPDRRIDTAQQDMELIDLKGFLLICHSDLSVAATNNVFQHPFFPGLQLSEGIFVFSEELANG